MEPIAAPLAIPHTEIFKLHSRPGSSNVLYLDFDGHIITGTRWNSGHSSSTGIDPHPALPYDPSNNDSPDNVANFTALELDNIGEIWHRMAEDFAPYDIDITTEEPASFTSTTGRVLFTHDVDFNGNNMPAFGAGGVAWINVFGTGNYVSLYSPALVYYTNVSGGAPGNNAEAGSHEFGHNISLGHDGISGGATYYGGHGSGFIRWGPIMGGSYGDHVSQWSQGEYTNANNTEDDVAIIAGDLGFVSDDHGNTSGAATELVVAGTGDILVSSPETDPHNLMPENKGVINSRTDVDWFYVDVAAGDINLVATPAWHSFCCNGHRGANLDIEMTLYDSALVQQDYSQPADDTFASVSLVAAPAGRYYIRIDGVGSANYTDYNSMGMYFIEGTVEPVDPDITKPSPDPMTFAIAPAATGPFSIEMTATTATDDSGFVEYQFQCTSSAGGGCSTSPWQSSTYYEATGLDSSTQYSYVVRARDSSLNTTDDSTPPQSATTDPEPPNAPSNLIASVITQTSITLSWTDNASDEDNYKVERSLTGAAPWTVLSDTLPPDTTSYPDSGLNDNTTYYYRVSATNSVGASGFASGNFTTLPLPPNGPPTNLAAVAVSGSQIDLSWTDGSTNEDDFEIQRSLDGADWGTLSALIAAANATSISNTGLNAGTTYYYRIRARNGGGNSSFDGPVNATTDYPCTASKAMPANQWFFFSLPCMPPDSRASQIFATGPAAGDYGATWILYVYDNDVGGSSPGYAVVGADTNLQAGVGYQYYATSAHNVTVEGDFNSSSTFNIAENLDPGRWNLMGNPHNGSFEWTGVSVTNGNSSYNFTQMDFKQGQQLHHCDQAPPGSKCRLWRVMNMWGGNSYLSYDGTENPAATIDAFDAFWVRSHRADSITLPSPAAPPAEAPLQAEFADAPIEDSPNGKKGGGNGNGNGGGKGGGKSSLEDWEIRLVATSGTLEDAGNRLGQAKSASDGFDSRDLEEWTPYSSPYLSILFSNPDFPAADWGYTTDFRKLGKNFGGDWAFVVRASSGVSEVTLQWHGDESLFSNATLVNEVSGETVAIEADGSYTFTMSGDEHAFTITIL
ncbi:MAG: hypothetical protein HKN15_08595 [Xanthomonadales bacterium]|nr:hypothetical protein [Xanthomonadales bacterium]